MGWGDNLDRFEPMFTCACSLESLSPRIVNIGSNGPNCQPRTWVQWVGFVRSPWFNAPTGTEKYASGTLLWVLLWGPYTYDLRIILGFFDPLPPLVCIHLLLPDIPPSPRCPILSDPLKSRNERQACRAGITLKNLGWGSYSWKITWW